MTSIADLERDRLDRQRAAYRRLQETAAAVAFEKRHGRKPADAGELAAAFKSGTVQTVNPSQYLDAEQIARVLSGATATG